MSDYKLFDGSTDPAKNDGVANPEKVRYFCGIPRPVADTANLDPITGIIPTKWEFVQDSAHYPPVFFPNSPKISTNGHYVELDFGEQVNRILSASLSHDGVMAAYPASLSINTSKVNFNPNKIKTPLVVWRAFKAGGTWKQSFVQTPTDTAAPQQNFDQFTFLESTTSHQGQDISNVLEITSERSYVGFGTVRTDNEKFHVNQKYSGTNFGKKLRLHKFDSNFDPVAWENGDNILIDRELDDAGYRVRVDPRSAELHELVNANYWIQGFVELN